MTDRFDVFGYDGEGCYFCSGDVIEGRTLCRTCALHHTEQEVAAKRLIASILRQNRTPSDDV